MMANYAWVTVTCDDQQARDADDLARNLRNVGTCYPVVVMVSQDLSQALRERLDAAFDEVHVLSGTGPARGARAQTLAKIQCWKLLHFSKCVFIDSATTVLQRSDELFEREELSAPPSNVWPDYFSTNVFVYRPSWQTYEDLKALAQDKTVVEDFDNDMVLFNTYFSDWGICDLSKRLSFLYHLTPSNCYTYAAAHKKFGPGVKMVARQDPPSRISSILAHESDHRNVWKEACREFTTNPEACADTRDAILPSTSQFIHYPSAESPNPARVIEEPLEKAETPRVNLLSEIPFSEHPVEPSWDTFFSETMEHQLYPHQNILVENFTKFSEPQSTPALVKSHYLYGMGNQYSFEDVQSSINRILDDNLSSRDGEDVPIHIGIVSRSSMNPFEISETSYNYWSNPTKNPNCSGTKTIGVSGVLNTDDIRYFDNLQHRFRKYNPLKEEPLTDKALLLRNGHQGGESSDKSAKQKETLFKRLNDTLMQINLTPDDSHGFTSLLKHINLCLKKINCQFKPMRYCDGRTYSRSRARKIIEKYDELRDKMNTVGEVLDDFLKNVDSSQGTGQSKFVNVPEAAAGSDSLSVVKLRKAKAVKRIPSDAKVGHDIALVDDDHDILTRFDPLITADSFRSLGHGRLEMHKPTTVHSVLKSDESNKQIYNGGPHGVVGENCFGTAGTPGDRIEPSLIEFDSRVTAMAKRPSPFARPNNFTVRCSDSEGLKFCDAWSSGMTPGGFQDILMKIQETMRKKSI